MRRGALDCAFIEGQSMLTACDIFALVLSPSGAC